MEVRDVMTKTPMTIDPEAPVETAVAVMRERAMRHLPVVDGDGRLIGIVTDRDLRSAMFGSALAEHLPAGQGGRLRALTAALNDVRVSHVMTWRVVTIGPQAPVAQAAAIMANVRVGSLPVIEGNGWSGSSPSTTCSRRWPRRCHASRAPIPTRISGEFQLMQTGDGPQVRWGVTKLGQEALTRVAPESRPRHQRPSEASPHSRKPLDSETCAVAPTLHYVELAWVPRMARREGLRPCRLGHERNSQA